MAEVRSVASPLRRIIDWPRLAAEDRLEECNRFRPAGHNDRRGHVDVFWSLNLFFTDGVSIEHHEHLELRHV